MKYKINKPPFTTKNNKVYKKFQKQINKKGICDSEMWNLDVCIAHFVLPRLKLFKKGLNDKEWNKKLKKMIWAFEFVISDTYYISTEKEKNKLQEGLFLFAEHFQNLWD